MPDGGAHFPTTDIAAAAMAMGLSKRALEKRATKERWPFAEVAVRGGRRRLYGLNDLPPDVQAAVFLRGQPAAVAAPTPAKPTRVNWTRERIEAAWARHAAAPGSMQETAARRLSALQAVEKLVASGHRLLDARALVAAQLQRDGFRGGSVASLGRWAADVDGAPRDAWLAVLVPEFVGRTAQAECAPQLWDFYKGHYLTRRQPSHAETYRRAAEMAREQGWTLPSAKTLERRIDREVSRTTQVLLREGPQAAAVLLPPQQRDSAVFTAGEAVNGDGLKFDALWVRFEDGEVINTATGWFWQDIRTRKILAWRLAKTENTDLFRLATYDLTAVCAPTLVWIDNTRVAANKLMTAGAKGRHRFRADPEDGLGMLLMLGMDPRFTNPSKETGNPGAKPIERAFGIGGLHHEVANNPRMIDRGYSRATAIDVAELREVIAFEVARHNARIERRTAECRGVLSFNQAWDELVAQQTPRLLSDTQRRLLLMSREVVRAESRSGFLALDAGRGPYGRNRYWCEHLAQHAGQKLVVLFDPENLSADVHVYGLDGRYLFAAQHHASVAFNDTAAGREHAKFKQRQIKARKAVAAAEERMSAIERASLYESATGATLPMKPEKPQRKRANSNVVAGSFRRVPDPARDPQRDALSKTGTDDQRESVLNGYLERLQSRRNAEQGFVPEGDR